MILISGRPVSPHELGKLQAQQLPSFVFDAVNSLLARKRTFTLEEASAAICEHAPNDIDHDGLLERGYLDFEEAYRSVGWEVQYRDCRYVFIRP